MTHTAHPGGTASLGAHTVARIGYGAMQLGTDVSTEDAVALLHRAVELGIDHVDTAPFYADGEVDRRIRRALSDHYDDVLIVSKVGGRSTPGEQSSLALAQRPAELRAAVEIDLSELGVDCVPVVNLRRADIGPGLIAEGEQSVDLDDQLAEMITLRDEGKIGAIGISNVDLDTLRRAEPAGIVCVQNAYGVLDRCREDELDFCRDRGIAWVPYFPLGSAIAGLPKVSDDEVVRGIAAEVGATAAQVGLAWLLAHAPNVLLIAGTRSRAHLEQNVAAGDVVLDAKQLAALDAIGAAGSVMGQGDGAR